jgi:hypothetical protein
MVVSGGLGLLRCLEDWNLEGLVSVIADDGDGGRPLVGRDWYAARRKRPGLQVVAEENVGRDQMAVRHRP